MREVQPLMRWPAKVQNSWDWQWRFAWYPIRVDYEDGTSKWVWLEYVETRLIVREGGAWTLEGRLDLPVQTQTVRCYHNMCRNGKCVDCGVQV